MPVTSSLLKISNKLALRRAAREQAETLSRAFAGALKRRLYPNTGLKREALAQALGVSHGTITNHISGATGVGLQHFWEVASFFGPEFLSEVMQEVGVIPVWKADVERASAAARVLKLGAIATAIDELRRSA